MGAMVASVVAQNFLTGRFSLFVPLVLFDFPLQFFVRDLEQTLGEIFEALEGR